MANEMTGAVVFSGGDQGIDDHHAGRGGDGNASPPGRWIVHAVPGHEHAVQQRTTKPPPKPNNTAVTPLMQPKSVSR
jgi:hypothetical protein